MNGKYLYPFFAVCILALIAWIGSDVFGLQLLFGVILPYVAVVVFFVGFVMRMLNWARSTVPFRIPTTAGQAKTMDWLPQNKIDNPFTTAGVVARMFLEVVTFRSLFRNTKLKVNPDGRIAYDLEVFLWLGALAFHYTFLVVLLRHARFFLDPLPIPFEILETIDTFVQIGQPTISLSSFVLLAAVLYLFIRRLYIANVRYISLATDYFPLFLIIGIVLSGILMRYFFKVDVATAKEITYGLTTFQLPALAKFKEVGAIFYIHMFFVSVLLAYFPWSKLMHLGGIFLSPTRNLPNNSRAVRHVNPWNAPVHVHTYEEYEDDFREKMIEAGLPVDKKE
ncbi:MAG: sulfate reduction electron transfer complex DsrMKJOP subunit DsrM [Desulfobacterales bacterium]|nr:sulfate reduction electron transfer complex DsrMKJOP subunit DsrM [Desulfobacterales bacterium]